MFQVSPYRYGLLRDFDPGSGSVQVAPWPDPAVHPVLAEQALTEGYDHYLVGSGDDDEEALDGSLLCAPLESRTPPGNRWGPHLLVCP